MNILGYTALIAMPHPERTPWGIFHNLGYPEDETGYVYIHFASAMLAILWKRKAD